MSVSLHMRKDRRVLELFSIFGQLLRADLVKCWKVFHSEVDIVLSDGLTVVVD